MAEQIIATIVHGSRLFGTTTDRSDVDIKTVFVPAANDILLGRVATSNRVGTSNLTGKNTPDDTDQDNHDLTKFIRLIESGSPEGFELLFAPDEAHLTPETDIWKTMQGRRNDLLHADLVPFERLIRKTSTIVQIGEAEEEAAQKICTLLSQLMSANGKKRSISPYIDDIVETVGDPSIVRRAYREGRNGIRNEVLVIAHKSVPVGESFSFAHKLASSIAAEAASNQLRTTLPPEQWKHLSLAVRLSSEMIELLELQTLTFPRPEREFLYDIKIGKVPLEDIKSRLEALAKRIETAKIRTSLPKFPKQDVFDNVIIEAHLDVVKAHFGGFTLKP